jgi:hypothetical protein
MKIEILSVGKNPLTVMSLLRDFGGMTLFEAQKMTENLPSSFVCNLSEERMADIFQKFEETGSKVEFTTGIGGPKTVSTSNYISKILFRQQKETKQEEVKLTKFSEIKEYLEKKADFKKAMIAGFIGMLFLTVIISIVYSYDGEREWWYDILTGLAIGFSIKHAGKGTDGRFGIAAAGFTLLTLIFLQISFTVILMHTNEIGVFETFNYVKPSIGQIIRAVVVAYLAFSISFTLVEKKENSEKKDLSTSKKISDYINFRKKEQFGTIIAKNDRFLNNKLSVNDLPEKKKKKKKKDVEDIQNHQIIQESSVV